MSDLNKKEYELGDKVKVVSLQSETNQCDCEIGIGDTGVIIDVDENCRLKYCVESDEGGAWWWEEENLELLKEEETMPEQKKEQTPKTPYQEKGYTENSLFKFVGDDRAFELDEVIKLHSDGDDIPDFKSITRDRCRYCTLDLEVEYIGEEGDEDMLLVEDMLSETEDEQHIKDNVNSPSHYKTGKIECIVAMEDMLSPEEFIGYLRGNIFKYTYRYKDKNGIEDLKKSQWYLNKLIEKESEKDGNHG